jgi:vacuolar-type H+-ATPase subunit F/Vma7
MQILIIESTNSEHSKLIKELAEEEGHKVLIATEKQTEEFKAELKAKKNAGEKFHIVLSRLYCRLKS